MHMRTKNRLAIHHKATDMEPHSPYDASAIKDARSQHRFLRRLVIAAAIVIVPIFALHKTPAAASAPRSKSGNGATAPWEKTAGPPGVTTNVIFKANNIVYAGTETQGVYRSTDNGLSWVAANAGIERTSISDMIVSGANLLAAVKADCPTALNIFKSTDNGATWTGTTGLAGKIANSLAL